MVDLEDGLSGFDEKFIFRKIYCNGWYLVKGSKTFNLNRSTAPI